MSYTRFYILLSKKIICTDPSKKYLRTNPICFLLLRQQKRLNPDKTIMIYSHNCQTIFQTSIINMNENLYSYHKKMNIVISGRECPREHNNIRLNSVHKRDMGDMERF